MKKKVKLPKNFGKLSKENEAYIMGFNDGWETCKEVIRVKNLKAKKKK